MHNSAIRKTVFYLFITLFFVSAPIIVFYTAGFRWNITQGFTRTGTMFIASVPKGATVFVNDKEAEETTPVVLTRRTPGDYSIRIEFDGHLPWSKRLTVTEGTTTFVDNVILFANEDPSLHIAEEIDAISWSPNKDAIVWANHQEGWTEIWVSQLNRPASRLVSRFPLEENVGIEWVTNEVISIMIDGEETLVRSDGTTSGIELANEFNAKVAVSADMVEIIDGSSAKVIARLPHGAYSILDERGHYILLEDTLNNKIALLNRNDVNEPLLLFEDATSAQWIGQDVLLFATPFAISIYEPSRHQTNLITRISEEIHTPQWHPDGKYLFYATDNELRVIELDDRDGRRVTVLATMEDIQSFSVDPKGRRVYVAGDDGIDTGIFRRELYRR